MMDDTENWAELGSATVREQGVLNQLVTGRTHRRGMIAVGGRRVHVKLCVDPRRAVRLQNEWVWLRRLWGADPDIVPEPLGYAAPCAHHHGLLVAEALAGVSLDDPNCGLEDRRVGEVLGKVLARCHRLPLTSYPIWFDGVEWRSWSAFLVGAVRRYVDDIARFGSALPADLARAVTQEIDDLAASLPDGPWGPVHGDATLSNVIVVPEGSAKLIDFEGSHYGDPLVDLAIARLFDLTQKQASWEALLEAYGTTVDSEVDARIRRYMLFRQVRLVRGKAWIHGDAPGYVRDLERLKALVAAMH